MTTRTTNRTRIKWIAGTRMARRTAPPEPIKPHTCAEGASLDQLLACYGYLLFRPNGHLFLAGFYPRHELEAAAERIRQQMLAAKSDGKPGNVLVMR